MGLGLHGGGTASARFFARAGASVTVTDLRKRRVLQESLKKLAPFKSIRYVLGRHRMKDFEDTDVIVKNPGIPPHSPYLKAAENKRIPIISDIGFFFMFAPARMIGVTGTRGKSTTAHLIWKFLSSIKKRVFLGGNIRTSVLDFMAGLFRRDIVVLELSSFQLKDMEYAKKSPSIGVITNVFRDHLNWHGSMHEYRKAKKVIFRFQKKHDCLFVGKSDAGARALARHAQSRISYPSLPKSFMNMVDRNLGMHYRDAAALAVAVGKHFRVPEKNMLNILRTFTGLEGRQEHIGVFSRIHFVNDTTSTVPEATIAAIKRFRKKAQGKKLILIVGGSDKGLGFNLLAAKIKKEVDHLILLPGTATEKLKKALRKEKGVIAIKADSMKKAVSTAKKIARKGDWVLLSPGAASFGLFANEFDRGRQFITAARNK